MKDFVTSEYSKNVIHEPRKRVKGHQFVEIGTCVRATAMLLFFCTGDGYKPAAQHCAVPP